jgi:hypothetical protein
MRPDHIQAYKREHTELCERALVTTWNLLDAYREHLVLIGGMVPRYLCKKNDSSFEAGTLDVDLGLSISVLGTSFNRIADRLKDAGFTPIPKDLPATTIPMAKFSRQFPGLDLHVEFITDRPTPAAPSIQTLDNMLVPAQPGIGRALAVHRDVEITAKDLSDVPGKCHVKVCEVGPFLCLKLRACGADAKERHGKDAFDIINVVQYYDQGIEAAFAAFAAERGVNPAFTEAVDVLSRKFADSQGMGPGEYAGFSLGGLGDPAKREDFDLLYQQHCETAALIADRLRKAADR